MRQPYTVISLKRTQTKLTPAEQEKYSARQKRREPRDENVKELGHSIRKTKPYLKLTAFRLFVVLSDDSLQLFYS